MGPVLAVLIGLAITSVAGSSQGRTDSVAVISGADDRPKIGIVLGGGGAKSSAHIGVLGVLEELRIPIDYVAGTSVGAAIGGLPRA